ncbi:MAG: ABC transporter ATP-binding protein [Halioglobus sp.]
MIEVHSLSRRYGKTTAVDDVSFHIGPNEVVGLLGHNGAGKTTIMRMLSGYLEPSAGTIRIGGQVLEGNAASIQRELGYLPENLPMYPEMMVADYLEYAATLKGIAPEQRYDAVRQAIVATDLGRRALDPVATLSRGLKQRVGVAQAILGRPRLLILDEPTNGLDPQQTEHMRRLIQELARQATIILSTHIMQEVDAICERVLVIRHGRLALDARLDNLRQSRTMMLRTDNAAESLATSLRHMPEVAELLQHPDGDNRSRYTLTLHENADMDTAANNVAHCVMQAGARLHQLQPVVRGLEAVFHEVNSDES